MTLCKDDRRRIEASKCDALENC